MRRYILPFSAPVVTFLIAALPLVPASAQTPSVLPTPASSVAVPTVHLAARDAQTLAGALRSVAKQADGVAFVAEGTPFRARGSAPPLVAVAEKWSASGLPLNEAVQKIAGAYDYDAERKGDVFLLRKRYTNPNDLPEVTIEELRLALRDASRAASALSAPTIPPADGDEPNTPFMASFFKTLPSDAQAYFTHPPQSTEFNSDGLVQIASPAIVTLQISRLNPQLKNALWQCTVQRYIQFATGNALRSYQALQTVERSGTAFTLSVPQEKAEASSRTAIVYAPKRKEKAVFPYFAPEGKVDAVPPVSADYSANGSALPFAEQSESAQTRTLGELCQIYKKPNAFVVDPGLEQKHVLVILPARAEAEDRTLKEAVFRAAGAVYGLRVFHGKADAWHIARDRAQSPKEFGALNTAVLSAFPEPLLRAFFHQFVEAEAKELTERKKERESDPDYDPKKSPYLQKFDKISARSGGRFKAQRALREAIVHRFRVLVEPSLAPDKTAFYSNFSEEARRFFTLAIASDCLVDLAKLGDEQLPPTRDALEKSQLSGFLSAGGNDKTTARRFGFMVFIRDENDTTKGATYTIGNITVPVSPAKAE